MTDYRRYFCNIRIDSTFNAGNLPQQDLQELNEKIEGVLEEWAMDMQSKGLSTDIGWSWSEHMNI